MQPLTLSNVHRFGNRVSLTLFCYYQAKARNGFVTRKKGRKDGVSKFVGFYVKEIINIIKY